MRLATVIVAALLLLVGCSSGQPETAQSSTRTPSPTPAMAALAQSSPSPTGTVATVILSNPTPMPAFDPGPVIMPTVAIPTAIPSPTPAHPQESVLEQVGVRTSLLRSLFAQREIAREFITKDELSERLSAEFEEHRDQFAIGEKLYKVLGILSPETVLYDLMLGIHTEGVLGFYDPDEEKFFVVKDSPEFHANDLLTYSHEYTHGLQQQYFDIKAMHEAVEDNNDMSAALRALREGDASVTEVLYLFNVLTEDQQREAREQTGLQETQALDLAPHVVRRTFAFPYREGLQFVGTLFQNNFEATGWQVINDAYKDPPESTEQILHLDKFIAREPPATVQLPDIAGALGESWSEVERNTMGEFFLLAYLESSLLRERASLAATGWGGDRYALLEGPENESVLVMRFVWDAEGEAKEFFDVFLEFMGNRTSAAWEMVDGDTRRLQLATADQSVFISIDAADTLVIFAPDAATVEAVRGAIRSGQ